MTRSNSATPGRCRNLVLCHKANCPALGYKESGFLCWRSRHEDAWIAPRPGPERAIKSLISGFADLADASEAGGQLLGEDGYFGEHAKDMIQAMLAALNLDMGRLDCGSLDTLIRQLAKASGVELES